MKKINLLIASLTVTLLLGSNVYSKSGCCSWHGGEAGCDTTTGRIVCNDGEYSPTCTCPKSSEAKFPSEKLASQALYPSDDGEMDDLGQVIHINTYLKSFKEIPSWTLIIRDAEHGQNIPYIYDFADVNNTWLAFTFGTDYTIISSRLSFSPSGRTIENFCHLEGMGRLQHGKGINVTITGKLTPHGNAYECVVEHYPQPYFVVSTTE